MQENPFIKQILEKLETIESQVRHMSAEQHLQSIDIALLRKSCVELYETILHAESMQTKTPFTEEHNTAKAPDLTKQEELDLFAGEHVHTTTVPVINDLPEVEEEEKAAEALENIHIPDQSLEQPESFEKEEITLPPVIQELQLNKGEDELLHEKIAKTVSPQNDLSQRFQSKIESLKSAITLNRKIAFVNDLFKENTVEYATAIEMLNNATDLTDALRIFGELKYNNNWDESDALVKELESLVVKRYQPV